MARPPVCESPRRNSSAVLPADGPCSTCRRLGDFFLPEKKNRKRAEQKTQSTFQRASSEIRFPTESIPSGFESTFRPERAAHFMDSSEAGDHCENPGANWTSPWCPNSRHGLHCEWAPALEEVRFRANRPSWLRRLVT